MSNSISYSTNDTYRLTDKKWKEWQRKRRHTLIGFSIVGIAIGMDSSVLLTTLYLYLRDVVHTERADVWYGVIAASFFTSSTVFGVMSGRWLDKTRSVQRYVKFAVSVQITGLILYVIPLHPVFLLVGRLISGIGDPFTSVVSGEVIRVFDEEGGARAMMVLASIYSVGFIIGPSLNFLFIRVEFKLFSLEINHLNFVAIFMAGLLLIVLVVSHFLVYDCSKELDVKEYLQLRKRCNEKDTIPQSTDDELNTVRNGEKSDHIIVRSFPEVDTVSGVNNATEKTALLANSSTQNKIPVKIVLKQLLTNKDTLLILLATFVFIYALEAASASIPLLVTVILKFDLKTLSLMYMLTGVSDVIFLVVMAKYSVTNKAIYRTTIISIFSLILMCAILIAIRIFERNYMRDLCMIIIYLLLTTLGWSFDDVMVRVMFAALVPSEIQSFSETLRASVSRVAIVAGSFTVAIILPWIQYWSIGIIALNVMLLVGFIARGRSLSEPTVISFTEYRSSSDV